jgi:hypothetical protein
MLIFKKISACSVFLAHTAHKVGLKLSFYCAYTIYTYCNYATAENALQNKSRTLSTRQIFPVFLKFILHAMNVNMHFEHGLSLRVKKLGGC